MCLYNYYTVTIPEDVSQHLTYHGILHPLYNVMQILTFLFVYGCRGFGFPVLPG